MSITKHNYVNKGAVPKRQKNTHTKVNNTMPPQVAWACIFQRPSLHFKTKDSCFKGLSTEGLDTFCAIDWFRLNMIT